MARKSKTIKKEHEDLLAKTKEVEELLTLSIEEETKKVNDTKEAIDTVLKDTGLFCGIILTPQDVFEIIRLMIQTQENVKIGYNLYFEDN